jgi:hypothetical protein
LANLLEATASAAGCGAEVREAVNWRRRAAGWPPDIAVVEREFAGNNRTRCPPGTVPAGNLDRLTRQ